MYKNTCSKGVEKAINSQPQVYKKLTAIIIEPRTPFVYANSYKLRDTLHQNGIKHEVMDHCYMSSTLAHLHPN